MKFNKGLKRTISLSAYRRFEKTMYGREKITLIDNCLNVAEEWASDKNTNYFSLPKNEMEKDLQKYLLDNVDIQGKKKSKFIPSFVWYWIATQVVKWIVKKIIDNLID